MVGVSVASEFEHAVQVLDDVAPAPDGGGDLDEWMSEGPPGSCWSTGAELPSVSVAVALLLGLAHHCRGVEEGRRARLGAAASASRGHYGQ